MDIKHSSLSAINRPILVEDGEWRFVEVKSKSDLAEFTISNQEWGFKRRIWPRGHEGLLNSAVDCFTFWCCNVSVNYRTTQRNIVET